MHWWSDCDANCVMLTMTLQNRIYDRLTELRREFHQHPEPAWCEYYTMDRLVNEITNLGVDELHIGRDALATDERLSVPDQKIHEEWLKRAHNFGADDDLLAEMSGGYTGAVAVLKKGNGPTIGLRVDIDGLYIEESNRDDHLPTIEGFRSENEQTMHACGHDAHMAIGLGVLEDIKESDFEGTFKLFLQPAEESGGGGKPMAESGHLDDVDYLLALHVGLNHPTGEVVAGMVRPLSNIIFTAEFSGKAAHAGVAPERGHNAIQALGTAIQNSYAIPRNSEGATRVNIGRVEGGTASNIISDSVQIEAEVRGETTEMMEYMFTKIRRVLQNSAEMHDCEFEFEITGRSPRADSNEDLSAVVYKISKKIDEVTNPIMKANFGGSEDATCLMNVVEENGGKAAYSIIGTDHPADHHNGRFDIDEASLDIGVKTMTNAIRQIANECP